MEVRICMSTLCGRGSFALACETPAVKAPVEDEFTCEALAGEAFAWEALAAEALACEALAAEAPVAEDLTHIISAVVVGDGADGKK
mmetsp:Transcript_62539/g.173346  ORF Transcript_62539/g.173346 Transcript_62539/m.173346 type:complete len:86 (+) Transcript_62539:612-869(+)